MPAAKPQIGPFIHPTFRAGLVGAWVSTSGNTTGFRDYSGNRQDAIYQSPWAPVLTNGPYGPAVPFDGVGGHFAQTAGLSANGPQGTIAVVAQFPSAYSGLQTFAGNSTAASGQVLRLAINGSAQLRIDVGTVAFFAPAIPTALRGTWATIVARWDAGTQEIWVNGYLLGSNTAATGFSPPAGDYLQIGFATGVNVITSPIDSIFLSAQRWPTGQVRRFAADPFWGFRPRASVTRLVTSAPAAKPWLYTPANQMIGGF